MSRKCENRGGDIIRPCCLDGKAARQVTVVYHENPFKPSGETSDTLELCQPCAELVTRDAIRHGYTVRTREL